MTAMTEVTFHSDHGDAHAAINVKVRCPGAAMRSPEVDAAFPENVADDLHEWAWDALADAFWTEAHELAERHGLPDIYQEGRSGGWLIFGGWPAYRFDDADDVAAFLPAYREIREWAEAWVADVPRRVRERAHQMGMDRAGEGAAQRMWAA